MKKRMRQKKRMISIFLLIVMLLNFALPQSGTVVQAAPNPSQQSVSSETFNTKEVNRILDGLTPEQKANINKLTGADIAQKIHVEQKDLRKSSNIQVIFQFKTDPAKIQVIKHSLKKGGATAGAQAFASEFVEAQQKVKASHKAFQSFVDKQAKTQIIGGKTVNTKMSITTQYTDAFNGVALTLPGNQVAKLAENPEVAAVWPVVEYTASESGNTSQTSEPGSVGKPTSGLTLMGVDKLQAEGHTGIIKTGPRAGQKVKVGVLDTGIDYNHPDLYKVTHDANGNLYAGHDFANPTLDAQGNIILIDDHDPMETIYPDWVEAKANPSPITMPAPADYKRYITSHGTHVSGTIAANTTNNNGVFSANGMAPDVELHGYRVLGPGGSGLSDSVLKGIDQAVIDKMDVINLSLGSNQNDPFYPTSIAINNATLAGVVCSVSAGNSGPGTRTVGSPGTSPLAITVGASSIPEELAVMTIKNGNTSYQARLFGKTFADADDALKGQTLPIVDVGLGSAADFQGKGVKGKIALVHRGGELLQTKMANAYNAGAKAMIIWDNQDDTETQGYISAFLGVKQDNVYSISLTQAQGQALTNAIKADPNSASITFPMTLDAPIQKNGDDLAGFSSTGPVKDWTIKPDVVAPGVNIMSTAPYDIWESQDKTTHNYQYAYQSMSGTSMAAPHTTGAIALVLAAHPDYTPADVKTALMSTAKDVNTDSKTYSVYQVGAGRIDPERAIKSDVKVQVLDKATTVDTVDGSNVIKQIDQITGSMFFGFKGRGEGATNGTDDVVQSKDFNVTNQGTSSKTFNVSTNFISTKFALSNKVGPGTGNDVKIDFTNGGEKVTSILVGGNSTAKTTATITVPSNALDGTYEGYIHLVNAADANETYRIPFTITVAEKGIDFKVEIKAFTLPTKITGNWNIDTPYETSMYTFTANNKMKDMYIVVKDKDGKYIGLATGLLSGSSITPGVTYSHSLILREGIYLPFVNESDGSYDHNNIATSTSVLKEGAYSVEAIATDEAGRKYTAEDTVYIDTTKPTMTMDNDSKPGIYEIDPTGYQPGQEIKGFYGTVFDSNMDIMKNNGETSVLSPKDGRTPVPVDQALNRVWGYQDSIFPTTTFDTDANGRFHFGVTPEDLTSKFGSEFKIYPSDYSGAADVDFSQYYYFIKKGTPYLTFTSSNGVTVPGIEDKFIVDDHKSFKTTIATKNGIGMTGGTFVLYGYFSKIYTYSNISLTEDYKNYLNSKGIDPKTVLTVADEGTYRTTITLSVPEAGALTTDMNILEADVTASTPDPISGAWKYALDANLTFKEKAGITEVSGFPTNTPSIRQSVSLIRGRLAAEAFARNNVSNLYPATPVETGAKVTVTDTKPNGETFITDEPTTTDNNTVDYKFISPNYAVTVGVSDSPYKIVTSMPGHFKGYATTPVIGDNKNGYNSGSLYSVPPVIPVLLGGDVNGDNVIDMNDLLEEASGYASYKAVLGSVLSPAKKEWMNRPENRKYDIYWISTSNPSGWTIDYNDFYFIFKNFGKKNQSAIDAGLTVPTPQLTVNQTTTITSSTGSTVTLNAGDDMNKVMAALNFAGPTQKALELPLPTLPELQNGKSITLVPESPVFLDDLVWRNAITKVELSVGTPSNYVNVTSDVSISAGYSYFDPQTGQHLVPSKINLPGKLFTKEGNYTVRISAAGYQNRDTFFTIKSVSIPTPTIPVVSDPDKAHIGQDLTLAFTDDANWRNGINKIVVKTANYPTGMDITNLTDGTGNKYYDNSQSGKITFKADLFKTNASPVATNSPINPGGANWLPQNYKFEIDSTSLTDGTIYPKAIVGNDINGIAMQPVGYGVTFDSQGGAPVAPVAVGYAPSKTRVGADFIYNNIGYIVNPSSTRTGYVFSGWFTDKACTIQWNPFNTISADVTVYAKWVMNFTQNYSPVDSTKPNGLKFDRTNGSITGTGWVLGEGDLKITIPDYTSNIPWLTNKDKISKIEATYYKINSDGTTDATPTTYSLDSSTYKLESNGDGSGTLSFTTATESYATAHPDEKFAFSSAPSLANAGLIKGYKLTVTATTGETVVIPDVKLGYRRHIDLNGGTLTNPNDLYFADTLVNAKATVPNMETAINRVKNGTLSVSPTLYLDSKGTSGMESPISQNNGILLNDNATYYLSWIKTPPNVSKDILENTVGSDITLNFQDNGTWKNNIKEIWIGSKKLNPNSDYTISDSAITLNRSLFTTGQKVNVKIVSLNYVDAVVYDQVIGYMVTFDSNGGDSIPAQIVDRSATKPADPTMIGYKFYGWYTNKELTTPFDFTSIVTMPITLYAKYVLAGSLVSGDSTDNSIGNDMTLEFSDSDWAKAINGIRFNGNTLDITKYKVNTASRTITLDKSLFTSAKDYTIIISAKDYSDVTVIQKVLKGYNVHFVVQGNAPFEIQDKIVARRITEPVVYGYDLTWFVDEACTLPWEFTNSIYADRTLYGKWTPHQFSVVFDHQDGSLVDSKTADYSKTITAPTTPTRPGYAFLGWYKDTAGKTAWNFATNKVEADTILYAKWATGVENNGHYNKDVIITFNEATAKLDGKDYTSGTAVTSEGNHTLVVTDTSGNETTVKFTIDKTSPVVTGVSNNGLYKKDVIITFNEGTAKLDGNDFTSGKTVNSEGSHTLVVTDAAGNATTIIFTIDKTAPNAPTVDTVTSKTREVTGTAEANSTIYVKEGKDTIGIGKTDQDGKFTISIKKQKKGTNLYVTAKDIAGNVSAATKVTVSK